MSNKWKMNIKPQLQLKVRLKKPDGFLSFGVGEKMTNNTSEIANDAVVQLKLSLEALKQEKFKKFDLKASLNI